MTDAPDSQPTRSIEASVEVPGTPEEVWTAIATGPGVSSWFVPAEVEEAEGGAVSLDFGSEGSQAGVVLGWEPPRRFHYGGADEGAMAFEWIVEATSGGTCVVRLVNSGFGDGQDWDDQYDGMSDGWAIFLESLRLHLTHHKGERATTTVQTAALAGPNAPAWSTFCAALGVSADLSAGDRFATGPDTPGLVATVATTIERPAARAMLLRVDEPAPGTGFVTVEGDGETVATSVYLYLYGPHATAGLTWSEWLTTRFPPPGT